MKTSLLLLFFLVGYGFNLEAQIKGCTDPSAFNFDPNAEMNDGSCLYSPISVQLRNICNRLSDTLKETSGLIVANNQFYTINDGGNSPLLYAFRSNGSIANTTQVQNTNNIDWEELCQDDSFIYIGDFGNNGGNRTNLRILKIHKSTLLTQNGTANVEIIHIMYADQDSFNMQNQSHNFDMEAMFVKDKKLHLFSKNWEDGHSKHYICSTDTGSYTLAPVETIENMGLITGAAISREGVIAFTGYEKGNYMPFIWICWDYQNLLLNTGNRRKIMLGTPLNPGQIEALTFNSGKLLISNEKYLNEAQLHEMNYENYVQDTFTHPSSLKNLENVSDFSYRLEGRNLHIDLKDNIGNTEIFILNTTSSIVYSDMFEFQKKIDLSHLAPGIYWISSDLESFYPLLLR